MSSSKAEKKADSSPAAASASAQVQGSPAATAASSSGTASSDADVKSRGWPKGKKRYPKMPGAPKQPLSGYVHFLNDRREDVRKECPDISFADISKKLAVEWSNLDPETKQRYVSRAEQDKERYGKEFAEYQKTDDYKKYMEEQERKKKEQQQQQQKQQQKQQQQGEGKEGPPKKKAKKSSSATKKEEEAGDASDHSAAAAAAVPASNSYGGMDFPVFTDEFLEFNKGREAELRQLRKQVAEMEEQNSVLQKHVDNMQSAIAKLEAETAQQQENSAALTAHLDSLRRLVVRELSGVRLPGWPAESVSMDNVDEFMRMVRNKLDGEERSAEDRQLLDRVKEVVGKISYDELVR